MKIISMRKNTKRAIAYLVSAMMVFSWVYESGLGTVASYAEEIGVGEAAVEADSNAEAGATTETAENAEADATTETAENAEAGATTETAENAEADDTTETAENAEADVTAETAENAEAGDTTEAYENAEADDTNEASEEVNEEEEIITDSEVVFSDEEEISITYKKELAPITVYLGTKQNESVVDMVIKQIDEADFNVKYSEDGSIQSLNELNLYISCQGLYTSDDVAVGDIESITAGSYKYELCTFYNAKEYTFYAPVEIKSFASLADDAIELEVGKEFSVDKAGKYCYYSLDLESKEYSFRLKDKGISSNYAQYYLFDSEDGSVIAYDEYVYGYNNEINLLKKGKYYLVIYLDKDYSDNCNYIFEKFPEITEYEGNEIKDINLKLVRDVLYYGVDRYDAAYKYIQIDITDTDGNHSYLYRNGYSIYKYTENGYGYTKYYFDYELCRKSTQKDIENNDIYAIDENGNKYTIDEGQDDKDVYTKYGVGEYYFIGKLFYNGEPDKFVYNKTFICPFSIVSNDESTNIVSADDLASGKEFELNCPFEENKYLKDDKYIKVTGLKKNCGYIYEFKYKNYSTTSILYAKDSSYVIEFSNGYGEATSTTLYLYEVPIVNSISGEVSKRDNLIYILPNRSLYYQLTNLFTNEQYYAITDNGTEKADLRSYSYSDFYDSDGTDLGYEIREGNCYFDLIFNFMIKSDGSNPSITLPITVKAFSDIDKDIALTDIGSEVTLGNEVEHYVKVYLEAGVRYKYDMSEAENLSVALYDLKNASSIISSCNYQESFEVSESGNYVFAISYKKDNGNKTFTVNEESGLTIDGKEIADISVNIPNDTIYLGVDNYDTVMNAARFEITYTDGSKEYLYKADRNSSSLYRLSEDGFNEALLYYSLYYNTRELNDKGEYTYSYTFFEDINEKTELYIGVNIYSYVDDCSKYYKRTLYHKINIGDISECSNIGTIDANGVQDLLLQHETIYEETDYLTYDKIYKIDGAKKGYTYCTQLKDYYSDNYSNNRFNRVYADGDDLYIRLSYVNSGYKTTISMRGYAPISSVDYIPIDNAGILTYYKGFNGWISGYYTEYYKTLFNNNASYRITYADGSTEIIHSNKINVNCCEIYVQCVSKQNQNVSDDLSLDIGKYAFVIYVPFYTNDEGDYYLKVPFEVVESEKINQRAASMQVGQIVSVKNQASRKGDFAYYKLNLEAGHDYSISTVGSTGGFSALLYDGEGNPLQYVCNNSTITVNKSGNYFLLISTVTDSYSDGDTVNIKLKQVPKLVSVEFDASDSYRDTEYVGLYNKNIGCFYPFGAKLVASFDDGTSYSIRLGMQDRYDNYYEFMNYIQGTELKDSDGNTIDDYSTKITEAGTYYYHINFKGNAEPVDIPIYVLDPKEADSLVLGQSVTMKNNGIIWVSSSGDNNSLYTGSANLYKIELTKDNLYRFSFNEYCTSVYLYSDKLEVLETYSGYIINYEAQYTGTYYIAIRNYCHQPQTLIMTESIAIKSIEYDSNSKYYSIGYADITSYYEPTGATFKITYKDGTVVTETYAPYYYGLTENSVITGWNIVDTKGNYYGNGYLSLKAGNYYYSFSFSGYSGDIKIPLEVKDMKTDAIILEEGEDSVDIESVGIKLTQYNYIYGAPVACKIYMEEGKTYFFNASEYRTEAPLNGCIRMTIYDDNLNIISTNEDLYRYSRYTYTDYYQKISYTANKTGTYYIVIENNGDSHFKFSYSELPEIISLSIVSQPKVTTYYKSIMDITNKWYVGLEVRLDYSDGTAVTARINEFSKYGIKSYLVDKDNKYVLGNETYDTSVECPIGAYRVKVEAGDLAVYSTELKVIEPDIQTLVIDKPVSVARNYYENNESLGDRYYCYYNTGMPKLFKLNLETDEVYKFSSNVASEDYFYYTIYDSSYNLMESIVNKECYFSGSAGTYYVEVTTSRSAQFIVTKSSKILNVEVVKQPGCVATGVSTLINMSTIIYLNEMELKVTFADGSYKNIDYSDGLWDSLVSSVNIYGSDNRCYSYGSQSYYCIANFSEDVAVRFVLMFNTNLCSKTNVVSESFEVTTDALSKNQITTSYTESKPLKINADYYSSVYPIKTEAGKNYAITFEGVNGYIYKVTGSGSSTRYSSSYYVNGYYKTTHELEGIDESEGIYCFCVNTISSADSGASVSLAERTASSLKATYEGMSLSLVDGMARVNVYYTLSGNTESVYASLCDKYVEGVEDTLIIDGKQTTVYKFSAEISADQINDVQTICLYDGALNFEKKYISVMEYAQEIIENKNNKAEYTKAKALVNALLNYGEYMEEYFATGDFENPKMKSVVTTDRVSSSEEISVSEISNEIYNNSESFTYIGSTLSLSATTQVNVYFKNNSPTSEEQINADKYTVYLNGNAIDYVIDCSKDYVCISFSYINIQDLCNNITFEIRNNSEALDKAIVTISPMNYIVNVLNNSDLYDAKLETLCRALYFYMDEAKKYIAA